MKNLEYKFSEAHKLTNKVILLHISPEMSPVLCMPLSLIKEDVLSPTGGGQECPSPVPTHIASGSHTVAGQPVSSCE